MKQPGLSKQGGIEASLIGEVHRPEFELWTEDNPTLTTTISLSSILIFQVISTDWSNMDWYLPLGQSGNPISEVMTSPG